MHYQELLEKLRQLPEEILLDLLGLTSEDLVDAFIDKIQEQEDKLHEYFDVWVRHNVNETKNQH